jgi:cell division septum initiation protein DivIVA
VVQTATNAEARLRLARTAQQALAEVRSRLTSYDSAFVEGTTASAASASLAELVADAATDAEAQLGPMQLMADTVVGTARVGRVSTRVHVSGDLMSIALFVQMLEEGPQLTAVREMSISPAQPALSRGQPERLQAELLVEGVFLAPGGKSRP